MPRWRRSSGRSARARSCAWARGPATSRSRSIPSGSLGLDLALGIGGLPRGRIIEIYGPESSGKTTLALHAIAEAQKRGGTCAFIDAEHALDPTYARKLGVDVDNLLISQPDAGEQALEIADTLVRSGAIDVLVVDSVAALVPRAELEGEMGDSHMGLHARLMSQALRKITGSVSRSNTHADLPQPDPHEDRRDVRQPGDHHRRQRAEILRLGPAWKSAASGRSRSATQVVGNQTRVKVVKNKLAPPFRQVEFDIMYGEGISKVGELIDLGVKAGVVEKSGAWFSYDSQRIGQGRENAKQFLRDHPDIADAIEAQGARAVRRGRQRDAGTPRMRQRRPRRLNDALPGGTPLDLTLSDADHELIAAANAVLAAALPAILAHGRCGHPRTRRADVDRPAYRRHGRPAFRLCRGGRVRPRGAGGRRHDRNGRRGAASEARRGGSRTGRRAALRRLPGDDPGPCPDALVIVQDAGVLLKLPVRTLLPMPYRR